MAEFRAKWLAFYSEHVEPVSREIFSHVEKMIIGTLIVSAGAHVSSTEPPIVLFGYLRHGLIGRGVMLFGGHSAAAEFPRRPLQARKAQLAYCVPNRDDDPLCRPVGAADPAHPCLSRRIAADPVSAPHAVRAIYRAANCDSTSLHAGESCAALVARHCTIRPPPGATPPQIERTSAPQAERSTNSSSRGRIGRSTITVGAASQRAPRRQRPGPLQPRGLLRHAAGGSYGFSAAGRKLCLVLFQALQRRRAAGRHARADLRIVGAAGAVDRGDLRAGRLCRGRSGLRLRRPFGRCRRCSGRRRRFWQARPQPAAVRSWARPAASTARTALCTSDDRLDMFFCRHCSEASPPGGMLEQCAM